MERYAAAHDWDLVDVYEDVDVSGFKRGAKRPGRDAFLASFDRADIALVYRVDRLARSLLDFSTILEHAEARSVRLISTSEGIDPGTSMGRAMLQIIGTFAELESRNISDRVKSSNAKLREVGRKGGGAAPFGFRSVANPDGPGKVLALDAERAEVVRTMARMLIEGESVYAVTKWLEDSEISTARGGAEWHAASVEAILTNPILTGTLYGSKRGELAILTDEQFRQVAVALQARKKTGSRPGRPGAGLLSGLVLCASCGGRMHRATAAKKYLQYRCASKACPRQVGISRPMLEGHVCGEVLLAMSGRKRVTWTEETEQASPAVAEIEASIREAASGMTADDADVPALAARITDLKGVLERVRAASGVRRGRVYRWTDEPFIDAWEASGDDVAARRALLLEEIDSVTVLPGGGRGRTFDPNRVVLNWCERPEVQIEYGPSLEEIASFFRKDE